MKKLLFIYFIAVAFSTQIYGQTPNSISVDVKADNTEIHKTVLRSVESDFQKELLYATDNSYDVRIGRSDEFFASRSDEMQFAHSGVVDENQVKEYGKFMGVEQLCVILLEKRNTGDYLLTAKIFDVETGRLRRIASYPDDMREDDSNHMLTTVTDHAAFTRATRVLIIRLGILNDNQNSYLQDVIDKYDSKSAAQIAKQISDDKTQKENFIKEFKKKGSLNDALVASGIGHSQFNEWITIDSNFRLQYETTKEQISKIEDKRNKASIDGKALGLSIIPGVGLMAKGHPGEGVAYLLGDLALIGGGVGMTIYANHLNDVINNPNSSYDAYNKAVKGYDTAKVTSYVCYGCAGALYIVNLIRAYVAKPTYNAKLQYSFVPVLPVNGTNPGIGISLAYKF